MAAAMSREQTEPIAPVAPTIMTRPRVRSLTPMRTTACLAASRVAATVRTSSPAASAIIQRAPELLSGVIGSRSGSASRPAYRVWVFAPPFTVALLVLEPETEKHLPVLVVELGQPR